MENRRILIDTSIVIDYLRSHNRKETFFIKLFVSNELCLSVISIFELYNGATTQEKKQEIITLSQEIEVIDFTIETAKMASEIYHDLRRKNKLIEFRDILIASTAVQFDIKIATINRKHFERIANLDIINLNDLY